MKVKRILITSDDGYNSIGVRLLVHFLKNDFSLSVAATLNQMSGVGGALSLRTGGRWGETEIEGVPVFWVDGYPCDAMELAVGYYGHKFDLVLSGINMGLNIGGAIVSSGTYSAAIRALNLKLASQAIALSWHCTRGLWQATHNGKENLSSYLSYPGEIADKIVRLAILRNYWGARLLNINFPTVPSRKMIFTRGNDNLTKFFRYPIPMNHRKHTFNYSRNIDLSDKPGKDLNIDTNAILAGYISVSPHNSHNLNTRIYNKMKKKEITL